MPGPNPAITLPGAFVVIAHFHNIADPSIKWRSTFDIFSTPPLVPQPTDPIILGLQAFWEANLGPNALLDEIELRNWSFGNVPFSQQGALWRTTVALVGTKYLSGNYGPPPPNTADIGGEVVPVVDRIPTDTGRRGHIFLRGLLASTDVVGEIGGRWVFASTTVVTPTKFAGIKTATIGPFFLPVSGPRLIMVRLSKQTIPLAGIAADLSDLVMTSVITTNKLSRKSKK